MWFQDWRRRGASATHSKQPQNRHVVFMQRSAEFCLYFASATTFNPIGKNMGPPYHFGILCISRLVWSLVCLRREYFIWYLYFLFQFFLIQLGFSFPGGNLGETAHKLQFLPQKFLFLCSGVARGGDDRPAIHSSRPPCGGGHRADCGSKGKHLRLRKNWGKLRKE